MRYTMFTKSFFQFTRTQSPGIFERRIRLNQPFLPLMDDEIHFIRFQTRYKVRPLRLYHTVNLSVNGIPNP